MIGKRGFTSETGAAAGRLGGRPVAMLTKLKAKAREQAVEYLVSQQMRSVQFLVRVRDNPKAPMRERVRCACEILDRGTTPAVSAQYHGIGTADELSAMFGVPKLVITEKYGAERNGDTPAEAKDDLGDS